MGSIIRQATITDRDDIIKFIEEEWSKTHIYVKDTDFFDYIFNSKDENINFIIAKEDEKIMAILGFVDYQINNEITDKDIFTVVWKSHKNTMAGIKCFEYLLNRKYRSISSCGINYKTKSIYKLLGIETGKMNHWYLLNNSISKEDFKIAKIENHSIQENINRSNKNTNSINENISIIDIQNNNIKFDNIATTNFRKSYEYFINHYINNPYYKYDIYGIFKGNSVKSIMVTREVSYNDSKCLRIIDFIGDEKDLTEVDFNYILQQNNYEYIDLYEVGLSEDILKNKEFLLRAEDDKNIIPNYFQPYQQKNIEIYYMTNTKEKFYMFKGDGDQDRPSLPRNS